jgi:hypothetical protein
VCELRTNLSSRFCFLYDENGPIFKKMAIFGKEKFTFRLYETQVSHKGFRVHYHSIIMFVVNHYVYVDF